MAPCSVTVERRAHLVRKRAADLGLSLPAVATRSRLSRATVEALASATPGLSPTRATLLKLARGLDLPAEMLVDTGPGPTLDATPDVEMAQPRQPEASGISRTMTVPVLSLSPT